MSFWTDYGPKGVMGKMGDFTADVVDKTTPKWWQDLFSFGGTDLADYQNHIGNSVIGGPVAFGSDYYSKTNEGDNVAGGKRYKPSSSDAAFKQTGTNAGTSAAILAAIFGGSELASGGGGAGDAGGGSSASSLTEPIFSGSADLSSGLSGLDSGGSALGASSGEWSSALGTGEFNAGAGSSSMFANAADLGQGLGTASGSSSFLDNFDLKGFAKDALGAVSGSQDDKKGGGGGGSASGGFGEDATTIPATSLEANKPNMALLAALAGGGSGNSAAVESPYAKALAMALMQSGIGRGGEYTNEQNPNQGATYG